MTLIQQAIDAEIERFQHVDAGNFADQNVNWTNGGSPPRPSGINQFPPDDQAVHIASRVGLHQFAEGYASHNNYHSSYRIESVGWITAFAQWRKVVQCTATPDTPFSQSISITEGSSTSTHFSLTYTISASAGIPDFGEISSQFSSEFGMEFSFHKEKTVSKEFKVEPQNDRVSVVWWQTRLLFLVQWKAISTSETFDSRAPIKFPETSSEPHKMWDSVDTFVSTQYPEYEQEPNCISLNKQPILQVHSISRVNL